MAHDFDLFVIGAGSGGVRAARVSAEMGARVAVAEASELGGTCVNLGCIPKKLMVYASHFHEEFEAARAGYGWTVGETSFDWKTLIANKDREILRLNGIYRSLLEKAGVRIVEGRARLVDRHTVEVAGSRFTTETILVATGSWPTLPEVPGWELAITSNEVFHLPEQPRRVLIIGGGYIAVEFAGIFHGLGTEVIQLYRGPLFLRGFDDDARATLAAEMRRKGIDLRFGTNVSSLERGERGVRATLTDGTHVEVDQVLSAIGRHPRIEGLGLEDQGVELDAAGAVRVDDYSCSSVDNIYAIGDVTNRVNLTPVAIHEAMCLARSLYGGEPTAPDHRDVPAAVFSQPSIGTVGLTEAEARDRYVEIDVYRSKFRALKNTLTGSQEQMMMKLVVDRPSQRVLGIHVVGPEAAEIVQGFAVAVKLGATKAQLDATIGIHPTAAEELVTMRSPVS